MVTIGEIFVVHFNYELLLYVLIARVLIYKNVGPGHHSDVARVRHIYMLYTSMILLVHNFQPVQNATGVQKKR